MPGRTLRIHRFLSDSRANGPGRRAVIWVQGCSLACAGCFNIETHPRFAGESIAVDALFERVAAVADVVEGVTISGGEPLQQARPLGHLLRRIRRETALSTVLFTGFTWAEAERIPGADGCLASIDVLIAGRYDERQRVGRGLVGSANKTFHFLTDRYNVRDLDDVPHAEVIVSTDGEVTISGIDPLRW